MAGTRADRVPLKVKLGFGVGDVGGNLFITVMGFYLLYYLTDALKIAAGLAGTALLISRIVDALNDPLIGHWSDRTRSRWGRRRPWIFWGSIATFFTMILMFTPPPFHGQLPLFLSVIVLYSLVCTAFTAMNTPYTALLPELTPDFHQRTVLTGFRMSFAILGTFVGALTVLPLVGVFGGRPAGWSFMGAVMGAVMMAAALITFFTIKERGGRPVAQTAGFLRSLADALKSREFLAALVPWTLHTIGVTIIQSSLIYYFQYLYRARGLFNIALMFLLVSCLAFIFVWVRISRRTGKKLAYILGMGLFAAVVIVFFLFGHRGGPVFAFVVMAIAGIGFATHYVMPHSMVPDVVECDYAATGVRREGMFYAVWNFAANVGVILGGAISGWVLGLFGYVADAPAGDLTRLGIRLLVGPIPVLFFLAGIVVLSFYPVTAAYYREVQRRIAVRETMETIRREET